MSERAKILKVVAIITSFTIVLTLFFIVTICGKDRFIIYPYLCLLLALGGNISLWRMYINEKNHNRK